MMHQDVVIAKVDQDVGEIIVMCPDYERTVTDFPKALATALVSAHKHLHNTRASLTIP